MGITNRPGLGVGRRLLAALEERGRTGGAHTIRLETNRALVEAIALYRSTGYQEVEALTRSRTPTTGSQVALTGQGVERGQLLAPFRGVVARASRFEGRGEVGECHMSGCRSVRPGSVGAAPPGGSGERAPRRRLGRRTG